MGAKDLKERVHNFVDKADERVLHIVNSVFENYYMDEPVAFHPDGTPMLRKEYNNQLDEALNQVAENSAIPLTKVKQQRGHDK